LRYLLITARPIAEDLAGTLAFYLVYLATGSPRLGAAIGVLLGGAQLLRLLLRRERVPALLAMSLALTAVLGGMTFATQNPRFLMLKPSLIYAAIGATMLPRGWLERYLPEIARGVLPAHTLARAGWAWSGLMFASALLNVALVMTLAPRTAALVLAVWASASKIVLFAVQYVVLKSGVRRRLRARQS